ncbi:MAG: alpha/beta hydrolase fold domain-containing protein [Marinilabiliaceae bacterium]|nr:alpha/beta hydrolase fold domain-containing protein [Marinilabiliaceae bacterium]
MPGKHIFSTLVVLVLAYSHCFSQEQILYKQIDTTKLFMELHQPEQIDTTKKYPAIAFFFGGGWNGGSIKQFERHANYFARRGMVCFLVDYRVKKRQHITPFESLKDAKSALRFIRQHAEEFHIDTSKIVASGGSAGGHLAAATALIEDYNESTDDLSVNCRPNALVLFNPVIDNGPGGYGYERIGDEYKNFSPLHNIRKGTPPTIFFLGTKDVLIPIETAEYYKVVMEKVKSRCELRLYEGAGHGFFNYRNLEYYKQTVSEADIFLQSLGYLKNDPVIKIE